jgi:hypothetical protein
MGFLNQQQLMRANASSGGGPFPTSEPQPPASGDLTLVFSNFATVDLLLAGGFDSLPDWNIAIVGAGNPYTSISVDEPNYTIYLSGGSNITLKPNAFTGIVEGNLGLGEDLISIVDTGTIVESNGYTFNACYILETVNLPTLAEVIVGDFNGCTKLKQAQLPLVTSVGDNGFYGAFNTATSPITLYLPLCTSLGAAALNGPIAINLPNTITATFPIVMETNGTGGGVNDEIQQLTAYSTGAIIVYV